MSAILTERGDEDASATWRSALMVVVAGWLIMTMSWKMLMQKEKNKGATGEGGRGRGDGLNPQLRLPPGPPALPIIGHLHLLGQLPHQSMYELARKYGPLMYLRLGGVHAIVASSPETARQVLQTHDAHMASRPATAGGKYLMFDASDMVFSPAGPYWRRMRQLCVTDLFSNRRLADFRPVREQEVQAMLRALAAEATATGRAVSVRGPLLSASSNIVSRMAFGSTLSQLVAVDRDTNIVDMVTQTSQLLGEFNLGDFIPWLDRLDLQGLTKRMRTIGAQLSTVFQDMIDRRRSLSCNPGAPRPAADLLDVLLSVVDEDRISDHNIKGIILDMLIGGIDSSSTTVECALAELLTNPSHLELLQEEITHVVPKTRLVQESDFESLPFLTAVVKETMRLHPIGPLLVPHESTKPCQINRYDIPTKARIYVNVWAIGRDTSAWSDPLKFDPKRFLNNSSLDDLGVLVKHYHLLPFGAGRRGCPGWSLGKINTCLMLANIIHAFEWTLQPTCDQVVKEGGYMKSSVIDMSERFGMVVKMAKPLVAIAKPRLSLDLLFSSPCM